MSGLASASDVVVHAALFEAAFTLGPDLLVQRGVKTTFDATGSPLDVEPIGVAAHLQVPPGGDGTRHIVALSLETSVDVPAALWSHRSSTAGGGALLLLEAAVDVLGPVPSGRAALAVPWCANLHHVRVPEAGEYQLVLSVDNVDACRLGFTVVDAGV